MNKILAFAGSNSQASINKQLAIYASELIEDAQVTVLDLNDFEMPIFSKHYENNHGIPENAISFLNHIQQADGIVLSLAENNGAYAAVFKNLFDWMSRAEAKLFFGKPMLLMATSPGGRGGISVLTMAKERFPFHNSQIVADFSLPSFETNFSNGRITNPDLDTELKRKVELLKEHL